jgi:hypothetical protein
MHGLFVSVELAAPGQRCVHFEQKKLLRLFSPLEERPGISINFGDRYRFDGWSDWLVLLSHA